MDPISEKVRAIQDLLRDSHTLQLIKAMEEALEPYKGLYRQIEEVQRIQDRNPELWRFIEQVDEMGRRVKSILSSSSAPGKWEISSDPNVPAEFKRKCPNLIQAKPRLKEKVLAVWPLIAVENPETSTNQFKQSNHPIPQLYDIEANAICQYLRLAKEHYQLGRGPVTKGELWNCVCAFHVACFKSGPPTHRALILKKIGLGSLKARPPGRPRKLVPFSRLTIAPISAKMVPNILLYFVALCERVVHTRTNSRA